MALVTCAKCQREISNAKAYCPYCGFKIKVGGKGYAISGLILGISSCGYTIQAYIYAFLVRLLIGLEDVYDSTVTWIPKDAYDHNGYSFFGNDLSLSFIIIVISSLIFAFICSLLSMTFGLISIGKGCRSKIKNIAITLGAVSLFLMLLLALFILTF